MATEWKIGCKIIYIQENLILDLFEKKTTKLRDLIELETPEIDTNEMINNKTLIETISDMKQLSESKND